MGLKLMNIAIHGWQKGEVPLLGRDEEVKLVCRMFGLSEDLPGMPKFI
jgi:hypothetical protein